ncbi:hypothetical protein JHK85_006730 [Glycine max]|nr:hypothetical protein JHK85_006730 [Glycine max]
MEPMNHNEGVCPTKMPLRKKKKFVLGHKVTKVAQQVIKASFKATHPITSQQDKLVAWKPEDEYQVKANFKSKGLKHLSQMLLESHRFGKPPHIVKVFKETHTRKKDNTWVDKRSEQKPMPWGRLYGVGNMSSHYRLSVETVTQVKRASCRSSKTIAPK